RRFHDLYVDEQPEPEPPEKPHVRPYEDRAERTERLQLTRKKLQHAFIMKEIIGPPKGIERMGE
ncbi:MAG: hypothetical protein JSW71_11670, partial [Gemmatimonadota bacterium]